ncbi:hypothetical protein LguiA_021154 [Lonicera macranthoides]
MATTFLHVMPICILLLLSPLDEAMAGRIGPTTTMAPGLNVQDKQVSYKEKSALQENDSDLLQSGTDEYQKVAMKPSLDDKGPVFHGKAVNDCMPKGLRHASAPRRYVNFHSFRNMGYSPCKQSREP